MGCAALISLPQIHSALNIGQSVYDILGRQIIRRLIDHTFVAYERGAFIVDRAGIVRLSRVIGPMGNIPSNEESMRELEKLKV